MSQSDDDVRRALRKAADGSPPPPYVTLESLEGRIRRGRARRGAVVIGTAAVVAAGAFGISQLGGTTATLSPTSAASPSAGPDTWAPRGSLTPTAADLAAAERAYEDYRQQANQPLSSPSFATIDAEYLPDSGTSFSGNNIPPGHVPLVIVLRVDSPGVASRAATVAFVSGMDGSGKVVADQPVNTETQLIDSLIPYPTINPSGSQGWILAITPPGDEEIGYRTDASDISEDTTNGVAIFGQPVGPNSNPTLTASDGHGVIFVMALGMFEADQSQPGRLSNVEQVIWWSNVTARAHDANTADIYVDPADRASYNAIAPQTITHGYPVGFQCTQPSSLEERCDVIMSDDSERLGSSAQPSFTYVLSGSPSLGFQIESVSENGPQPTVVTSPEQGVAPVSTSAPVTPQ